jgi:hypothetical protein
VGVYWVHLAEDRVQWRVVVNTVMQPPVKPYKRREILDRLSEFQLLNKDFFFRAVVTFVRSY